MIALLLSIEAGLAVAPLVIVAVVVAYLASETLTAYVDSRIGGGSTSTEPANVPSSDGVDSAPDAPPRTRLRHRP